MIKIKGEAYFDISRDPDNASVVKTEKTTTKTYGAKMNVKSDGDDVEVSVQEG